MERTHLHLLQADDVGFVADELPHRQLRAKVRMQPGGRHRREELCAPPLRVAELVAQQVVGAHAKRWCRPRPRRGVARVQWPEGRKGLHRRWRRWRPAGGHERVRPALPHARGFRACGGGSRSGVSESTAKEAVRICDCADSWLLMAT